jgi:hypothetical protein
MNDRQRARQRYRVGIAALMAAGLLAVSAKFEIARRATGREIAELTPSRDKLKSIVDRLDTQRGQAERDRRVVLGVMRLCRSAVDIPELGGNRVVAHHQGFEKLCFYVPQGSHTLEVTSELRPAAKTDAPAEPMASVWSVPLLPSSGYLLQLVSHRKAGPVSWELSGNHPDFAMQTETVVADGFSQRGSSWSGGDVILFPNQVERPMVRELESSTAARAGVKLLTAAIEGMLRDEACQIKFSVRVRSETPACISASDAQSILILGGEGLLQPYAGDGKYEIRTPPSP